MLIRLLSIGNKMPEWVKLGYQEYAKRLPHACHLELVELPLTKRNHQRLSCIEVEGEKLLATVKPNNRLIALDVKGEMWTTEQLSQKIQDWQQTGRNVDMLIGGPDGLSNQCLQQAEIKWSLSPLTLPHLLTRIFIAEQIYRAVSILQKHPYHR